MKKCETCDFECDHSKSQKKACMAHLRASRSLEKLLKDAVAIEKDIDTGWYHARYVSGAVFRCRGPVVEDSIIIQARTVRR